MARYGLWKPIPRVVGSTAKWSYGRNYRKLTAVVIHRMEGTLEGSDSYLRREYADYYPYPRLTASTHFGVGLWYGVPQIRQWVDTANTAWGWAARPTDTPTYVARNTLNRLYYGSEDLNWQVLSVEVEGFYYQNWNSATTQKVRELLYWIYKTHGNLTVMAHTDCSSKPCPGMTTFNRALPGFYGNTLGKIFLSSQPVTDNKDEMGLHNSRHQIPKIVRLKQGYPLYEYSTGTTKHATVQSGGMDAELFYDVGGRYLGRRAGGDSAFFFEQNAIDTRVRTKKAVYK